MKTPLKTRLSEILLLCCCEFCAPSGASAAFLDDGATARLAALGGSAVAMTDDAAALASNPAGLGTLSQPQVITDYSRLNIGLTDGSEISQSYVGVATPLSLGGTLACGWQQLNFDNLYMERTLAVGYGRWWTPRLALGANVKQLHLAYSPANQIVDDFGNVQQGTPDLFARNGTARSAYAADIGALYKWNSHNTLGLAIQNINEPNIALSGDDHDVVARTIHVGWASIVRPRLTLATGVQTQQTLADERDWTWTGGGELWLKENAPSQVGLRGSVAIGSREDRQIATGASYRLGAFQMDYAFTFHLGGIALGDSLGNHRFSIAYRFGKDAEKLPLEMVRITPAQSLDALQDEAKIMDELLRFDPTSPSKEVAYHAPY